MGGSSRRGVRLAVLAVLALQVILIAPPVSADQAPSLTTGSPATHLFVRNTTRVEGWSFFNPGPAGGDPTYATIGTRLLVGLERTTPRFDVTAALQFVQFGGLPENASGPGPLGTGALYYQHSGQRDSRQLYLRLLNLRVKPTKGFSLQLGRFGYTSGAEAASGVAKVEAVKRQRVDARLIGDFEWSLFQRSYDGGRLDLERRAWHATAAVMRPTQGGFEETAGVEIDRLHVLTGVFNVRPGRWLPKTDVQLFAYRYDDRRDVAARPDNTGRTAEVVDIGVNTFGATAIGAYPHRAGEADILVWAAAQTGSWYGDRHQAYAVAIEAGQQWPRTAGQPWLRAGFGRASGDEDGADARHGTFFQMLPTARRYSQSATYSLMNLVDLFAQTLLRPRTNVMLRLDYHHLTLPAGADRWYTGSGATQKRGQIFGYSARNAGGATDLGAVIEGSVDWTVNPHWSLYGYAGVMRGGQVVRRTFPGDRLVFAYIESSIQF